MINPDGRIASWNSGAERIKGYRASEILGENFSRFFTEEDLAAGLPQRALRMAGQARRFESEGWRVRKDGTRFWAMVVLDAVRDPQGGLVGFAKIPRDIPERMNAQRKLAESERQFRLLVSGVIDYAL